ncbi:MAG: DNA polymerase III subunit alpha [Reichenbachiella sp.]|uniref:DNA polymerase III subunit alpha n=1 Tax=Reichenbachiella sp. TaxID=2184521 RepID=UPI0032646C96
MYLNTHSYFSFKYGVMSTDMLLQEAQNKEISAFALTDINSTAGCMRFVRDAPKYGIRPIIGVDFRNGTQQQFVAIAKNNEGFQEINIFLSKHLHHDIEIPDQAPEFKNVYIIYPFLSNPTHQLLAHEYIGITPRELLKINFSKWKDQLDKLVMFPTITFRDKRDFNIHRLLRAIDNNTLLSKLPKNEEGLPSDLIYSKSDLLDLYKNNDQLILNTKEVIESCNIYFEYGDKYPHKNIQTYTGSDEEDYQLIRRKCLDGLSYRYRDPGYKIYRRLAAELQIIRQKGFVSYFLVNWDIIDYALRKEYFYVGRGSGANSIVAYLLRITDVDPIELDLYFERFINLYRKNPPDFDIDFSWRDRDDITKYIFERFGYDHVSLLATYNTFKFKAAVRELGKVCGLPPHEISVLSAIDRDHLETAIKNYDGLARSVLKYAFLMDGIPSHLSVHASGIIISEKPIYHFTATSMPPKGFPITHFDMVEAEDAGLFKFDILSQRGLGKIKDSLAIIRYNNPDHEEIDIHDTKRFFEDEKVKDLFRNGRAIGCFYVESPAMRMLLKKLRADHYLGLVAASSVIRPGVAKSGMMREYILRFRIPERRKEAHPILADLMPETFGVMVYQEDVIKVAHYFAGLTLGEADRLRRGMSGKYRSRDEFKEVERQFFISCKNMGHDEKLTHDVWYQIMSFAGYAFAKGHSASYAIESYQCLYLKAHYPLEYLVSVINNGGGFYGIDLYVHEARMHDATIEAPCINTSYNETIIRGKTIYLGFHIVKELENQTIKEILSKREDYGPFQNLEQFTNCVTVSLEQLKILIRIGAFKTIDSNKKKLLWHAHLLLSKSSKYTVPTLFQARAKRYKLPALYHDPREDGFDEMEILHFPLKDPFSLIKEYDGQDIILAEEMAKHKNKMVTMLGYMITQKRTKTSNSKNMSFGTFIDQAGDFIDTVHFPPSLRQYPFRGKGIYEIKGKVVEEFDFVSVEVTAMIRIHYVNMDDLEPMAEHHTPILIKA